MSPPRVLVFLLEEGIQQFFVLITLFGNVVAVGAGEVDEPRFGDVVLAVGL